LIRTCPVLIGRQSPRTRLAQREHQLGVSRRIVAVELSIVFFRKKGLGSQLTSLKGTETDTVIGCP
jgi:hypothetical protein